MATNIPPHNLREVAVGRAVAAGATRRPTDEELLDALLERIKGPDFPTRGAHRRPARHRRRLPHRAAARITMRAVVEVEEIKGRTCLVVTELPYQVNPDNLALKIAELVNTAGVAGHRRRARRHVRAHRPAAGHRAQARRRRQGRAQQPLQAHPAAGHLRREHARAGRRRAAHAAARRVHPALGRRTRSRSSSGAPAFRLREAEGQAHILPRPASRRSTRSTRSSP